MIYNFGGPNRNNSYNSDVKTQEFCAFFNIATGDLKKFGSSLIYVYMIVSA